MTYRPQSEGTFVYRMGPRCYGGLVNALELTEVPGRGCLFAMQVYVPNAYVKKGAAGRSGRVLTANDKRVCVARKGIMSAASLHSCGPEWSDYPETQVRVLPSVKYRRWVSVNGDVYAGTSVSGSPCEHTIRLRYMSATFFSRGSKCCSSLRDRGLQVRFLPGGQQPTVAQLAEHRYSTGFTSNISATPNERNGSKFTGSLRNVNGLSSCSRGTSQCSSRFIRSADRPESSGGPNATGYLPSKGSSRSRGAFPAATTCPPDRFRQVFGRAGRMVMVTSPCAEAGTRLAPRPSSATRLPNPFSQVGRRGLVIPGSSPGVPSRRVAQRVRFAAFVVRAPNAHTLPTWPLNHE